MHTTLKDNTNEDSCWEHNTVDDLKNNGSD
jgi:hypothetical protein